MNKTTFDKFPFGKYAGTKIKDLPTQYITHAIMTFTLPDELLVDLTNEIMDRFAKVITDQLPETHVPISIHVHINERGAES